MSHLAPTKVIKKSKFDQIKLNKLKKRLFCTEKINTITEEEIKQDIIQQWQPSSPIAFQKIYYIAYKLPGSDTYYCETCIRIIIKEACPEKSSTAIQEDLDLYMNNYSLTPTQLSLCKSKGENLCSKCKSNLVFYERQRTADITELYQ